MSRPTAIMPITEDTVRSKGHNWMIYGDPGVGKSPLAASSPRCLIVRGPNENIMSIPMLGLKGDQWVVETHEDLLQVSEYFRHEGAKEYDWVWCDTFTLMQEIMLYDIMTELHAAKPHRMVWAPDKGEYGQNMNRMSLFVREMIASEINFGLTAHVMRTENREGETIMMPGIHGKGMAEKFCGYFALVAFMDVYTDDNEVVHRRLRTDPHEWYFAKDGYGGAFKGLVKDPTVPKMLKIIGDRLPEIPRTAAPVKGAGKKAAPVKKTAATKVAPAKKAVAKKAAVVKKTTKKAS